MQYKLGKSPSSDRIDGMLACSTIRALDGQSDMSMQPYRAECEYRWRLRECKARSNRLFPFIRNESLPSARIDSMLACSTIRALDAFAPASHTVKSHSAREKTSCVKAYSAVSECEYHPSVSGFHALLFLRCDAEFKAPVALRFYYDAVFSLVEGI